MSRPSKYDSDMLVRTTACGRGRPTEAVHNMHTTHNLSYPRTGFPNSHLLNQGRRALQAQIRSELRFSGRSDPWFAYPRVQIAQDVAFPANVQGFHLSGPHWHHLTLFASELDSQITCLNQKAAMYPTDKSFPGTSSARSHAQQKLTSTHSPPLSVRFRGFIDSSILFLGLYVTTLFSVRRCILTFAI